MSQLTERALTKIQLLALPDGGTGEAPPGAIESNLSTLAKWLVYGVLAAGVLMFIVGCFQLAMAKRNHEAMEGKQLGLAIIGPILALSATQIIRLSTGT